MDKVKIRIGDESYYIPTEWGHLTLKQYLDLREWKERNDGLDGVLSSSEIVKYYSILLGAPVEVLSRTRNAEIDVFINPLLGFVKTPVKEIKTESLKINDVKYRIDFDLNKHSFEQKIAAENAINNAAKTSEDAYTALAQITAIYLQPILFEEYFDEDKALKYAAESMNDLNFVEVYSIGRFFLRRLKALRLRNQKPLVLKRIKSKRLRALINYLYLKRLIRLMR